MTRSGIVMAAALVLIAGSAGWIWSGQRQQVDAVVAESNHGPADAQGKAAEPKTARRQPTLYCEFTNFADRTPLVGFYFLIDESRKPPAYALAFQREQDGTQADFGGGGTPSPLWAFDGSQSPPVIAAPEDETVINIYDYVPNKPGVTWFEAGLRSIRYRNLGGKCRLSAV